MARGREGEVNVQTCRDGVKERRNEKRETEKEPERERDKTKKREKNNSH